MRTFSSLRSLGYYPYPPSSPRLVFIGLGCVVAALAFACTSPTAPLARPSQSAQDTAVVAAPPEQKQGCSVVAVSLGPSGARTTTTPNSTCGPAQPALVGGATFDPGTRVLTLPVAIHDGGRLRLHGPLTVTVSTSDVTVSAGRSTGSFQFVNFDSGSAAYGKWRISLSQSGQTTKAASGAESGAFVAPGAQSPTRALSVRVPTGVTAFDLKLRGVGQYVYTIPLRPPPQTARSVLAAERDSANMVHGRMFMRDKLLVRFNADATLDDRQAAIDAVDGTVVGGGLGDYYVRIPASASDTSGTAVVHAIHVLSKMTGVHRASLDLTRATGLTRTNVSAMRVRSMAVAKTISAWRMHHAATRFSSPSIRTRST